MNLLIHNILFAHKNLGRFIKCMARQVKADRGRPFTGIDEMTEALKFGCVRIWTLSYSGGVVGWDTWEKN